MRINRFAAKGAKTAICCSGLAMDTSYPAPRPTMKTALAHLKKTDAVAQFGLAKDGVA